MVKKAKSADSVYVILEHLADTGWVSLRGLAILLGYKYVTQIYQRQKYNRAIPTVKVGGQYRVTETTVIDTLKGEPEKHQDNAKIILGIYVTMKRGRRES